MNRRIWKSKGEPGVDLREVCPLKSRSVISEAKKEVMILAQPTTQAILVLEVEAR